MHSTAAVPARTAGAWPARAAALVRILVGLFFVSSGLPKLTAAAQAADQFAGWGVPLPDLAAPAVGGLEVAGGLLLAVGLATRVVAALLAALMVGAVLTAGLVDGGQHLVLPPVLGSVCAGIAVRGGGAWQLRHAPRRR